MMEIKESLDELTALLERHRGTGQEEKIRLLQHLSEFPQARWREIAEAVGRPEDTLRRWARIYRQKGLDGLLSIKPYRSRRKRPEAKTTRYEESPEDGRILDKICSTLYCGSDVVRFMKSFQQEGLKHLRDVDRISIQLWRNASLTEPSGPALLVVSHRSDGEESTHTINPPEAEVGWRQLFQKQIAAGFPEHEFHPPVGFNYYFGRHETYIGCLLLHRERRHDPISAETIALFRNNHHVLTHLFAGAISRYQNKFAAEIRLKKMIDIVAPDADLSPTEEQVLALRIIGYSHDTIANRMSIQPGTVSGYLQRIREKCDVTRIDELRVRYFQEVYDVMEAQD